jgi:hypothetical protein
VVVLVAFGAEVDLHLSAPQGGQVLVDVGLADVAIAGLLGCDQPGAGAVTSGSGGAVLSGGLGLRRGCPDALGSWCADALVDR